mgnify:CR=1 FL=1
MSVKLFTFCRVCHEQVFTPTYRTHYQEHTKVRQDGQMEGHLNLPDDEKYQGSLEEVPQTYYHATCDNYTIMPDHVVRSYLADPFLYSNFSYCAGCGQYPYWGNLTWKETGESLQTYFEDLQNKALKGVDFQGKPLQKHVMPNLDTLISEQNNSGLFKLALKHQENGDFAQALETVQHIKDFDQVALLILKGFCYENLAKADDAKECYQQAIVLQPDVLAGIQNHKVERDKLIDYLYINQLERKIDFHIFNQEYEEALEYAIKIQKLDPNDDGSYYGLAVAYNYLGEYEKSIEYVNKAIELNPQVDQYYYVKGKLLVAIRDYENAVKSLSKALEYNAANPSIYFERGSSYLRLSFDENHPGEYYQEAIADYNTILEKSPNYRNAHYNRGTAYFCINDFASAKEDYLKTIELDNDDVNLISHAYFKLGDCNFNLSLKKEACKAWKKGVELGNQDCEARVQQYCKKRWF